MSCASAQCFPEIPPGPSSTYLCVSVADTPTGRSPSKCLPLGTSSTISVCRGISMAQRVPGSTARTPTQSDVCGTVWLSLGSWSGLPHEVSGHSTSLRGSLRTARHGGSLGPVSAFGVWSSTWTSELLGHPDKVHTHKVQVPYVDQSKQAVTASVSLPAKLGPFG